MRAEENCIAGEEKEDVVYAFEIVKTIKHIFLNFLIENAKKNRNFGNNIFTK